MDMFQIWDYGWYSAQTTPTRVLVEKDRMKIMFTDTLGTWEIAKRPPKGYYSVKRLTHMMKVKVFTFCIFLHKIQDEHIFKKKEVGILTNSKYL